MIAFPLIPERTALINIDMQNFFVEGSPISAPDGLVILNRINRVTDRCREAGIMVIHTRQLFRPNEANLGMMGVLSPPLKSGVLNQGSQWASLHKDLIVGDDDILLDKPRYGAFHGTDLELILRSHGIDTLILCGIATNICCETTAREAAVRDFKVFFLSDGTTTVPMGDATAAELQKATCATLGFLFANVLTVDEIIAKIEMAMPVAV